MKLTQFPLVLVSCVAVSLPAVAQTVDFSTFSEGDRFESGSDIPKAQGVLKFLASPEGRPAGSNSTAEVVVGAFGEPVLRLITLGEAGERGGKPFGFLTDASAVPGGQAAKWRVTFDIAEPGGGSGVWIALVGGEMIDTSSYALNEFFQSDETPADQPALILGVHLFAREGGEIAASARRFASPSGNNARFSRGATLDAGQSLILRNLDPIRQYMIELGYDPGAEQFTLSFFDEGNVVAETTLSKSSIDPAIDLSTVRLVAGDVMRNSGYDWSLDIHKVEIDK